MVINHSAGIPYPLGAIPIKNGTNFAIFSKDASEIYLDFFKNADDKSPYAQIKLDSKKNKTGDIWHVFVEGITEGSLYLYRANGTNDKDSGLWFNKQAILLDPYAKAFTNSSIFEAVRNANKDVSSSKFDELNNELNADVALFPKCVVVDDNSFDWEDDFPLKTPLQDSIIYELHVSGYTKSPTSGVKTPGTYLGLIEKIPYLKDLGITAIELLPVFEFDENENERKNEKTGEQLKNFWGYSTFGFFAPKANYASSIINGTLEQKNNSKFHTSCVNEFKNLVKEMHKAGIEVILDVVFNHTAEGNHLGPTLCFRGLANDVYYILDENNKLYYKDYTGCGNTVNCNHPVVIQFILDCLHYWVLQMHVDGFRFDLASVLCRSENGSLMEFPYITRAISEDPILKDAKLIAEPWDAGGAYHTGKFPGGRWCSWNDKFRDGIRRFVRGEDFMSTEVATRLAGSSDLFFYSKPIYSINFVTVHDGFTLKDLVSYNSKHNENNGEDNRDGSWQNYSYNNGIEGETDKLEICTKRMISIKNMFVFLVLSQGVPLLLAGDEFERTQKGNNNAYCQDNSISWVDWSLCKKNAGLLHFVKKLIELRKSHKIFRRSSFFNGGDITHNIAPDILWYNADGCEPDWSKLNRFLAFKVDSSTTNTECDNKNNDFYFVANMRENAVNVLLPSLPNGKKWFRIIDTAAISFEDICDLGNEKELDSQKTYMISSHSIVLLLSKN